MLMFTECINVIECCCNNIGNNKVCTHSVLTNQSYISIVLIIRNVSVKYVSQDSYYGAEGGVFVAEIVKGGPADQAGFMLGDKVIRFAMVKVAN